MAGERTVPGTLGILTGWTLGSAYKDDMDENLRKLGVFCQLVADSFTTAVPSDTPADGAVRIVTGTTDTGHVYIRDNGSWVDYAPVEGMLAYVTDEDQHYFFDGTAWVALVSDTAFTGLSDTPTGYSGHAGKFVAVNSSEDAVEFVENPGAADRTTQTASFSIAAGDLSGNRIIRCDSASDIVVTVPSGIALGEPVTILREGSGEVSVTAGSGVTINSADSNLHARVRYSAMTLVPLATDTYVLIGDLGEAPA